jgi:hypothetical protein
VIGIVPVGAIFIDFKKTNFLVFILTHFTAIRGADDGGYGAAP